MEDKKKVMVVGSSGMLGSMAVYYFQKSENFELVRELSGKVDFVINCIGAIPQKTDDFSCNVYVPKYLSLLAKDLDFKIIQPSTDCVFSGDISPNESYHYDQKEDAEDDYGRSKEMGARKILSSKTGKVIRSSIIGVARDRAKDVGLMNWYLTSEASFVNGYTNHLWSGITTLKWAEICEDAMLNYEVLPDIIQPATLKISKFDLLKKIKEIFGGPEVIETETLKKTNRSLYNNYFSPILMGEIEDQLLDFKKIIDAPNYFSAEVSSHYGFKKICPNLPLTWDWKT